MKKSIKIGVLFLAILLNQKYYCAYNLNQDTFSNYNQNNSDYEKIKENIIAELTKLELKYFSPKQKTLIKKSIELIEKNLSDKKNNINFIYNAITFYINILKKAIMAKKLLINPYKLPNLNILNNLLINDIAKLKLIEQIETLKKKHAVNFNLTNLSEEELNLIIKYNFLFEHENIKKDFLIINATKILIERIKNYVNKINFENYDTSNNNVEYLKTYKQLILNNLDSLDKNFNVNSKDFKNIEKDVKHLYSLFEKDVKKNLKNAQTKLSDFEKEQNKNNLVIKKLKNFKLIEKLSRVDKLANFIFKPLKKENKEKEEYSEEERRFIKIKNIVFNFNKFLEQIELSDDFIEVLPNTLFIIIDSLQKFYNNTKNIDFIENIEHIDDISYLTEIYNENFYYNCFLLKEYFKENNNQKTAAELNEFIKKLFKETNNFLSKNLLLKVQSKIKMNIEIDEIENLAKQNLLEKINNNENEESFWNKIKFWNKQKKLKENKLNQNKIDLKTSIQNEESFWNKIKFWNKQILE